MSWQDCTLGDLMTLKRGHDLPNAKRIEGDVPVVSSSGVTGYHNEAKAEPPGVITGRYGTLGGVYFIERDYWPLNTALYVIDFKNTDPRFSAYFLKKTLRSYKSDKAAVPGLDRNVLHSLKVRAPDRGMQERIVDVLSKYDDLIENNKRRIELLEESARQLYKEWFVRFRFPGHEHIKIVEGVPKGWSKGRVSDLGEVVTGKTPSTKVKENFGGDIPFIKTPDIHSSSIIFEPEEYLSERGANTQANKYLPKFSILTACIGARLGVVSLNARRCQTNQQINAVIPKSKIYIFYSYLTLKGFREKLLAIGGGATMPNVNKSKFSSMEVLLPPESLLDSFHDLVTQQFLQMETLIKMNSKLTQARDILLPKLMNGEVAV
ncbi:type I restriction enzyme, S subunit [Marinobacter sp. es.048]|uniref:restriction endonuclease subunit S n=1 Tax=Marinobacter sp. es.048 TaxID=1761795 RepID=UPI000B597EE1|nr:restriction endonuclease subunit S [Marinobacter sp. es.048]SNC74645.1 type I restriction enzyme, S subunit [Marinobacter sp. es.048]